MDLYKHAMFIREFERPETHIDAISHIKEWSLPLLRIEAPRAKRVHPCMMRQANWHIIYAWMNRWTKNRVPGRVFPGAATP